MNQRSTILMVTAFLVASAGALVFLLGGGNGSEVGADIRCAGDAAASSGVRSDDVRPDVDLPDNPLEAYRGELLDLAFRAASKFPLHPHVKNRSRNQAEVVDACLRLGQLRRALACIPEIADWRRGYAYADLAFLCAGAKRTDDVETLLDFAEASANQGDVGQEWRKGRILARMAQVLFLLGRAAEADALQNTVADPSETGRVDLVKAMELDPAELARRIEALDAVVATGDHDQIGNALDAYARLFDRFYDDVERRALIEDRIEAAFKKQNRISGFESRLELAGICLQHDDGLKARKLAIAAWEVKNQARWAPEDDVALSARLATLLFQAGDEETARREVEAALALFDRNREKIIDIYRAGPLRALAEANHAIGDRAASVELYWRAIEEGIHNPNSRPRADDLVDTCVSMAVHGVEPDARLMERLVRICDELGEPW